MNLKKLPKEEKEKKDRRGFKLFRQRNKEKFYKTT